MRIVATIAVGAILVALVVAASLALSPGTQSTTPINTDALGMDAQSYASDYGVTVEEARSRLTLQESVGPLQKDLIDNESATFAGLWIQHEPEFRIITSFTQEAEVTVRPHVTGGPLAGIVDTRTADTTLASLQAVQLSAHSLVKSEGIAVESGINVIQNRVELYVVKDAHSDVLLSSLRAQLPNKAHLIEVSKLSEPVTNIYAGLELDPDVGPEPCTTGFSVEHSNGTKGILTAAHCAPGVGNKIEYANVDLPIQDKELGGSHDVLWATTPTYTVRNLINDGTYNRYVYSTATANDHVAGRYLCKYGVATEYGCGDIRLTNYTLDVPCHGGCQWSNTFITVRHSQDGVELADEGDSGGPWFYNNTAYGLMVTRLEVTEIYSDGTRKTFIEGVYMPIHYINALDVSVLTQ